MSSSNQSMHQDFARWYESVDIGDNAERCRLRWEGVIDVVAEADQEIVEVLLRLAYQSRQRPPGEIVQAIRQRFKDKDETFEMIGNDREVQVLAGASLAVLMDSPGMAVAETAALAATTAALGAARKIDLPMNLSSLGEQAIGSLGKLSRERPSLDISDRPPEVNFDESVSAITSQANWDGVKKAFSSAAKSTQSALEVLAQRQVNVIRKVDQFITAQDEELQMLWWLVSQYSEEYGCPFDEVPADAQPLVFASELADATALLPGPSSIKGILSRAGLNGRSKLSVADAVNTPTTAWLETLVEDIDPSPISTPLHFAIKRRLETGAGEAWVPGWAAAVAVGADCELNRLVLSELFYRERLLILTR